MNSHPIATAKPRVTTESKRLFRQAKQVMPYGVNSNFRYWGDDATIIIARGQGPYVWDVDDNQYIDYRLGFGPVILGHAHPFVNQRVCDAIQNGVTFASTTPLEIEAAERFTRLTGMDQVRLSNTGTEATMHALRIARAYTGREKFIKFEGNYHGNYDYVMFSGPTTSVARLGSRQRPRRAPASEGVPGSMRNYMISLPYNDFAAFTATMEQRGETIAAVLVEPIMGNVAGILPAEGWLQHLRDLCESYGVVLIFDEVKTGFRLGRGGAQEYFGVRADLAAYAKAMGNGFPVSAIAGKNAIMAMVEPGRVAHGGTYCGNAVAAAATCATLQLMEETPVLETIWARGQALIDGMQRILRAAGIAHTVTGVPSMFSLVLGTENRPTDYRSYAAIDFALYTQLGALLIERGLFIDDDPREPWFLSYSHDAAVINATLEIFEHAVRHLPAQRAMNTALPRAA